MSNRIDVKKTYKLYINGAFPRSESGRTYEVKNAKGVFVANPCLASRKDLRDAVVAARAAHAGWNTATAYNRGQILYRIAEMLEGPVGHARLASATVRAESATACSTCGRCSDRYCKDAAIMSRNSGCGRSGRLLNSGCACVPTQNG